MPYRTLRSEPVIATLERLRDRIRDRFPERGLLTVCEELLELAREDARCVSRMGRPYLPIRAGVAGLLLLGGAGLVWLAPSVIGVLARAGGETGIVDAFQGLEAVVNLVVLTSAAVWFLLNAETRIKRARFLADLHALRSVAHVIDMHQLTKDPTMAASAPGAIIRTANSPSHDLSGFELARYLDYCAEMLALVGKIAALYMQGLRDPVVIEAVNDIESLTANLSRKIWQKIALVNLPAGSGAANAGGAHT